MVRPIFEFSESLLVRRGKQGLAPLIEQSKCLYIASQCATLTCDIQGESE